MSDATSPKTGGAGGVLGAVVGLLLVTGLIAQLVKVALASAPTEAEVLAERLELGALPFGLTFQDGYRVGSALVGMYVDPAAEPEAERVELPESPESKGKEQKGDRSKDEEPYDWSGVELGAAGTAPRELYVERYGSGGLERVEDLFEPPREDDEEIEIKTFGAEGGTVPMDRGRVRWGDYDVVFVHNRTLEEGGTFVDWMLVNLSLPGRPLVLRVRWPRGYPGSLARVEELLEALRPAAPPVS